MGIWTERAETCTKYYATADVVEVRHGEWIDLNTIEWQCSGCNYKVMRWNNTPYCPNCGAKMDGGVKENDGNKKGVN